MPGRERDPDAFRCLGCETPTRGGRLCATCRDEVKPADGDSYDDARAYDGEQGGEA